jgi:hypothetical protein
MINHHDALEIAEFNRRSGDRRQAPRRKEDIAADLQERAFDAARIRAADEVFALLEHCARPSGSGGFVFDDVTEILKRAGYEFGGAPVSNR